MKITTAALLLTGSTLTTALVLPNVLHHNPSTAVPSPSIAEKPMHTTDLMAGKAWRPTPTKTPSATWTQLPTSAATSTRPLAEWRDL